MRRSSRPSLALVCNDTPRIFGSVTALSVESGSRWGKKKRNYFWGVGVRVGEEKRGVQGRLAAGIGGGFLVHPSGVGAEAAPRLGLRGARLDAAGHAAHPPFPRLAFRFNRVVPSLSLRASVNLKQTSRISEGQQGATVSVVRNEDPGDFRPERSEPEKKRERERVTDCMSSLSEKSDRIAATTDSTAPPPVQLCGAAALFFLVREAERSACRHNTGTLPAASLPHPESDTPLSHAHTLSLSHSHASAVQSSREEGRGSSVQHRLDTHAITNASPSRVPPTPPHPTSSFARRQRNRLQPAYTSALDSAP